MKYAAWTFIVVIGVLSLASGFGLIRHLLGG